VRLWQGRALLSWTEDDIVEVTRYLDQSIYRFGPATVRSSLDPHLWRRPNTCARPAVDHRCLT
jgi:hypothetical protein